MLTVPLHRLEAKERAGVVFGAITAHRQGYSSSSTSEQQMLASSNLFPSHECFATPGAKQLPLTNIFAIVRS